MSERRSSRRQAIAEPDELEAAAPRGRQAWTALLVMAVLIAAVIGSGLLIRHAVEPAVPAALANCRTSTQIAPHTYLGRQPMCITANQKLEATITTTQGDVVVQLHPEVAPVTVNNFVILATHGYYNGLTFWDSQSWEIQGGDPLGNGTGGPGYDLPDEPQATPWALGAMGMARVPGGAINGSQFFIEKGDWPSPGPTAVYNRFGTVISGMEHVQLLSTSDSIISITIKVS
ncbi:MAG TPA: peptidylprolyl isomerase [Candidatus Dormibacteraeota bacterium]|nr:peptidylprolyl isomerase [Candidatus Dormibacteraeota bacterium]